MIRPDTLAFDLPLSWVRSTTDVIFKKTIQFKTSKINWISLADLPESNSFNDMILNLKTTFPKGFLIRGCTPAIATELKKNNFEILPVGQEAIIDLNKPIFNTRALRQSARSGYRRNLIHKIELNKENQNKLYRLKKESRHGKKPQLKHLFIDTFHHLTECFIAEDNTGWNAAVTFSHVNPFKAQAELLLRKPTTASGTMEALINEVFNYLKDRGYLYFSLGEVPFVKNPGEKLPIKAFLMHKTGKFARFAYNSHSLFRFKNKFSPEWQSVFLCGYPKISLFSLIEMGIRSNYINLIFSQLPKFIKNQ